MPQAAPQEQVVEIPVPMQDRIWGFPQKIGSPKMMDDLGEPLFGRSFAGNDDGMYLLVLTGFSGNRKIIYN